MTDIQPATMDALDRLVDLWEALAESQREHGSRVVPAANRESVRESIARHVVDGGVLLARADDGVVGFVMFGPATETMERDRERGVVSNVYVEPDARGRGVGSALLDAAEARLVAAGADEVTLEVMADNEAARRLYRRRGYEPHRVQLAKPVESDTHTN